MRMLSRLVQTGVVLGTMIFTIGIGPARSAEVTLVPSSETLAAGEVVTVAVEVSNASGLRGYQLDFKYRKTFGKLIKVEEGWFLMSGGAGTFCVPPKTQGRKNEPVVTVACARLGRGPGASGSGTLALLTFEGTKKGKKPLPMERLDVNLISSSVMLVEDN